MNMIDEVSKKYKVKRLGNVGDVWFYEMSTPIMSIRHYLFSVYDGSGLFCLSQKDDFDEQGALKIKEFLINIGGGQLPDNNIALYQANNLGIMHFDTVVVLHGKYHNFFKFDVPSVYPKTYVVFPCHHSEFVQNSTDEEVNYSRNKIVNTMVWGRDISPRTKMWFKNASTGVKTNGAEPLLSDVLYVFDVMTQLAAGDGQLVLENYKFELIKLNFVSGRVETEGESAMIFESIESAKERVEQFLGLPVDAVR